MEKRTFLSDGYANRTKECEDLDRRYRKIGISAVAAAVRYQDKAKGVAKRAASARYGDQVKAESAA